ncbi:DUF1775 domain-containing protein [Saccharothrix sp. ST-888]|uniref:DUF1775 domain-containing protein n=1 Tax=Saccharothrix sp. ST-888 TaxID=1427391 RepID=UPI0005ED3D01|nr:DUF1775 domain-containing protein [Saccharothrix sp. ST-888]KJK57539.1 hypothetical protein UK12_15910 [Saccharothrix sp. ST-888]
MNRSPSRLLARAATPVAALAGVLALAGPALAHVEVESDGAQALAVGAVVSFNAEGESDTAGISQIRVALPTGIAPGDVTLTDGPQGWKLAPAADGYTVAGPALAPSKAADYKIKVRQLPDAKELVFKSLVTYSDGHVDRWIELPQSGITPEHPAPVLKLAAAAAGATPLPADPAASGSASAAPSAPASASAAAAVSVSASAASASSPASAASASASAKASDSSSSSGNAPVIITVVVVLAAAVVGTVWWRRRSIGS